jgi:surfactin synthase thioesterase subunit
VQGNMLAQPKKTHTPYLVTPPASDARPRLFCFHHAGGSASIFTLLRNLLLATVNVIPVQLPGREQRLRETLPADLATLVTELDAQLDPFLDRPYAFYGHSMGALVARDLAEYRRARGAVPPHRLLVGACRAPHLPAAFASAHAQPDEALTRSMLAIGGLSEETMKYPDWLESAITLTRNDLRLCASRVHAETGAAPYAIDAFHGSSDPMVAESEMAAWAEHTAADFVLHRIAGGHFFLIGDSGRLLAQAVARILLRPAANSWPRP